MAIASVIDLTVAVHLGAFLVLQIHFSTSYNTISFGLDKVCGIFFSAGSVFINLIIVTQITWKFRSKCRLWFFEAVGNGE